MKRVRVHLFFRKPNHGEHHSVERLFNSLTNHYPSDKFDVRQYVCPLRSKGVIRRILLVIWAYFCQGDVNHITGDINFLSILMHKRRTILTILDLASMNRLRGVKKKLFQLFWVNLPCWRAGKITAISENTLLEIQHYYPKAKNKLIHIPCCIPGEYLSKQVSSYRISCPPKLLIVGTKSNKNIKSIFLALRGINCELTIVGIIEYEDMKVLLDSNVVFRNIPVASNDEIESLYKEADCVLFIPTYEGFGLPILEAQAHGRALITSNLQPMSDVAGKGAYLVNPLDISAISLAVYEILSDDTLRENVIHSGLLNVMRYTPESVAMKYCELYSEISTKNNYS